MAAQAEALANLRVELAKQTKNFEETKQELSEKAEALVKAEEERPAQAENFKRAEIELFGDVVDAYAAVFEDALSQVVCKHPKMDTSSFATATTLLKDKSCQGAFLTMLFNFHASKL